MPRKKPLPTLENIPVESYAAEGKSLARVDGKVIFIEHAVPGDVVDLRLTKNKKDWAEGFPIRYRSYSPDRTQPFCDHFGTCGGCQWQMLPYEKQLQYKHQQVVDVLTRIGRIALPEIQPIRGAAEQRYYRNKIEYTFGSKEFIPKEKLSDLNEEPLPSGVAGFHARGFFDKVVRIDTCHLQAEPTNRIRKFIAAFAHAHHWPFYDMRAHVGFLRNLQIRLCRSGELMVNLVVGEDDPKKIEPLMQALSEAFPEITTLFYTINLKWNDSIPDLKPIAWKGPGYVIETLEDFSFKIGPTSFFQTNTKQAEILYQITREFAELTQTEIVYDLYCGTGSIGIFLSRQAKKIIGVELIEAAIEDARINAERNGILSTSFFAGDVIDICTDTFFDQHGRPNVLITDPPRAGMHDKLVQKILNIEAPLVIYVSCNPATQARDLQRLAEKYTVTRVQPVDLFPHTLHIENVVQLRLTRSMS
ncbi:MAG: 23S rRNA (uracil(1939)-C(5))-methyltransferase RlmD [Bacteroidetes bacterium]|nr:23S rRNA (uracil(1939)-C(5))-methyltransferase RlmD [Bacteroidota bacterium]